MFGGKIHRIGEGKLKKEDLQQKLAETGGKIIPEGMKKYNAIHA